MDESRTEQATPQKLARARAQGLVATSAPLTFGAALFALLAGFALGGERLLGGLRALVLYGLGAAGRGAPLSDLGWRPAADQVAFGLLGVLLASAAAAALVGTLQTGALFSAGAVRPAFERLHPGERL